MVAPDFRGHHGLPVPPCSTPEERLGFALYTVSRAMTGCYRPGLGTLSPLLRRLESSGLLVRQRRADDERIVQLSLTETGLNLRHDAAAIRADMGRATGLAAEEITELIGRINTLTTRLRGGRAA